MIAKKWTIIIAAGATVLTLISVYFFLSTKVCDVEVSVYVMVEDPSLPQHVYQASAYSMPKGYVVLDGARAEGNSTLILRQGGNTKHSITAPEMEGYVFWRWNTVGGTISSDSSGGNGSLRTNRCFTHIIAWYNPRT